MAFDNYECDGQMDIFDFISKRLENGNISPCPYKEECTTYPVGCAGLSYWCNRYGEDK